MIKHIAPISGVATLGNSHIATAGYDNQVILWDATTHKSIAKGTHDHLANSCVFSPCGRYLASASSDYSLRLWSVPLMRLVMVFTKALDDIEMVSFHPTLQRLAACSRDHNIYVVDFQGRMEFRLSGHTADVISVVWNAEGSELISSSDDGTIKRWDAGSGLLIETLDMNGTETDSVVITAEGVILAGNDEGEIILNNPTQKTMTKVKAHQAGIKRLVYHAPSQRMISLSYDRTFAIWHVTDKLECIGRDGFPAVIWPRSCSFLGSNELVFATFGDQYGIYEISSGTWKLDMVGETQGLNRVHYQDGQVLSVGDAGVVRQDGQVIGAVGSLCNFVIRFGGRVYSGGQLGKIFDVKTRCAAFEFRSPLNCAILAGPYVLVGTYTGEILVFSSAGQGLELHSTIQAHPNAIKGLAASQDFIFSVCATGAVQFHSIADFSVASEFEGKHERIANGCVFVHGETFASISRDLTLRLWTKNSCKVIASPHLHSIKCVAADVHGRYICTGAYDGHVTIYDRQEEKWHPKEKLSAAGISSLSYDSGGQRFLASSYDGRIYPVLLPNQFAQLQRAL